MEDRTMEINKSEEQKERRMEKSEQSLKGSMEQQQYIVVIPEGEERKEQRDYLNK